MGGFRLFPVLNPQSAGRVRPGRWGEFSDEQNSATLKSREVEMYKYTFPEAVASRTLETLYLGNPRFRFAADAEFRFLDKLGFI